MVTNKETEEWKYSHFERQAYFVVFVSFFSGLMNFLYAVFYDHFVTNESLASLGLIAVVMYPLSYFLVLLFKGISRAEKRLEFKSFWS